MFYKIFSRVSREPPSPLRMVSSSALLMDGNPSQRVLSASKTNFFHLCLNRYHVHNKISQIQWQLFFNWVDEKSDLSVSWSSQDQEPKKYFENTRTRTLDPWMSIFYQAQFFKLRSFLNNWLYFWSKLHIDKKWLSSRTRSWKCIDLSLIGITKFW